MPGADIRFSVTRSKGLSHRPFVQPRERVRGLDGQYALEGSTAPEDAASASEADDTPSTMDSRIGT
jgi:hypothetical protein